MKILVSCPKGKTFDSFFDTQNCRLAESLGEVVWNPFAVNFSPEKAARLIEGCDVYMTTWGAPPLSAEMLEAAPNLKLLAHLGGDAQPFMSDAAWDAGVKVISGETLLLRSVAEGSIAYILSSLRKIPEYSSRLKYKNEWRHSWDTNQGLVGKTVGIVNYSDVAAMLVRLLSPFGVNIMVYDDDPLPKGDVRKYKLVRSELNHIFSQCDVICVYTPKNRSGYHMIGSNQLSLIKKGALLVDVSSGGVVNHRSLAIILMNRRFFALLDVYEKEPPEYDKMLFLNENVTLMPHMAGPTPDTRLLIAKTLLLESAGFIEKGGRLNHRVYRKSGDAENN